MGFTKTQRIAILLAIDGVFFLVELIVGYAVHSLALVADAFHMLNDVLSLCVGLWAVRVANQGSSKVYTFGWQRAETLGALVNGVFLVALCLSIFLEAIQRFVEPQVVSNPFLVLIVGCLGLASNLLGLFLFHDHSHSHGHGAEGHSHSHGNEARAAEEGHAHAHAHSHQHEATETTRLLANDDGPLDDVYPSTHVGVTGSTSKNAAARRDEEIVSHSARNETTPNRKSHSSLSSPVGHRRRTSAFGSVDDIPVHPASFRHGLVRASQFDNVSEPDSEEAIDDSKGQQERQPSTYGAVKPTLTSEISHSGHNHRQPRKQEGGGGGHGHSHGDLNMRGVFLHVLGDALGNVGVIVTALIIWLTDWSFKYYFDPGISLVITVIILYSAIPLCKAASRILLQAVPFGVSIDDIREDIEGLPGVVEAHHVHVWQLSDTKFVASLHVKVDCEVEGAGSASYMRLARAIRQCLHEYGIHSSTIQPEFLQGSLENLESVESSNDAAANGKGAPDHSHGHGNGDVRVTSKQASRASSLLSVQKACMLDCGDDCETNDQCCPPDSSQKHDKHDDSHAPGQGRSQK